MILILSCMMVDCHNVDHNYLSSASTIKLDSTLARKMPRSTTFASKRGLLLHMSGRGQAELEEVEHV